MSISAASSASRSPCAGRVCAWCWSARTRGCALRSARHPPPRLLPRHDRRERLGLVLKQHHPCDLAAPHLVQKGIARLDLDPACPRAPPLRGDDEHLAPHLTYLMDLLVPVIEGADPLGDDPARLLAPAHDAAIHPHPRVECH